MSKDLEQFSSMLLSDEMMNAIQAMNFSSPTEIQAKSIPVLRQGSDIIGQAQTGTGKTAAFSIPLLEKINAKLNFPQGVVLCPTRELAQQVAQQIEILGKFHTGLRVAILVGGQSYEPQLRSLKRGAHIVVGTPGRVIDHIQRRTLDLSQVVFAVLDEADEMLDMGFRDAIEEILGQIKGEHQTALFSATMPAEMKKLASRYLKNPVTIKVGGDKPSSINVRQVAYRIGSRSKLPLLTRILDIENPELSIVFRNTIREVGQTADVLKKAGYSVDCLHGDLRQNQRDMVLTGFREGRTKILVATDVAARGLDVKGVKAVFNMDLPMDSEDYVHRIGRTGRADDKGVSYSFVSPPDRRKFENIARTTKMRMEELALPSIKAVQTARANRIMTQVAEVQKNDKLDSYREIMAEYVKNNGFDAAIELGAALLKIAIARPDEDVNLETFKDSPPPSRSGRDGERMGSRPGRSGFRPGPGGRSYDRPGFDRPSFGAKRKSFAADSGPRFGDSRARKKKI